MKKNRRDFILRLSYSLGAFCISPFALGKVTNGLSLKKQTDPSASKVRDVFLPKKPKLYDTVDKLMVTADKRGRLPKIIATDQLIMGGKTEFIAQESVYYSAQYLGPHVGWNIFS